MVEWTNPPAMLSPSMLRRSITNSPGRRVVACRLCDSRNEAGRAELLPNGKAREFGLMKKLVALLALAVCLGGACASPATADPYRWCAEYGNRGGGGTNCYFATLGQCQAGISGN